MSQPRFPHSDPFLFQGHEVSLNWVREVLRPRLTDKRKEKISAVVRGRTYNCAVVLENIYDRGNASAVMRSAEAFGIMPIHHIEIGDKFKVANRVASGADKWLDQTRHESTKSCVAELKGMGYQIVATSLSAEKPIGEVDFSKPSALVLGNEKDGISEAMRELADEEIKIPMSGFVESFNISVAGALALYHIHQKRVEHYGDSGDLTDEQRAILEAVYSCRSNDEMTEKMLRYS